MSDTHASVDDLPMELLVAIFDITCEDTYDWDPEEPRMTFQLRPPAHFPQEAISSDKSRTRLLKPDAHTLALVCRHWFTVVMGGGMPQMWETIAEFQSWKGDGTTELARFNCALARSKGSDIHINFVSTSSDSELTNRDPQLSARARLQFHALAMVKPYRHQLKSFVVSMPSLTLARFAMDLLESMAPCPRLTWVSFDSSVQGEAVAYPDLSTVALVSPSLLERFPGVRYPKLQHTLLHGRGSTDRPNLPISPSLEHFYLRENATELSPMRWPLLISTLNQCLSLVRLALSFRYVVELPQKPFRIAKHVLPSVRTLILDAYVSATIPFLSSFAFPRLKFFQLSLQSTSPHPWSPHWAPIILPSVQKLRLRSASPLGSVLFTVLHLPGLLHLDIGDYTWQLDFLEPHPAYLKTPESLLVAATSARSAVVQISRSDLSATEAVRFQLEIDDQGVPPPVDVTGLPTFFNFSNLVHLSFGEFDFKDVDYLCGLLEAPRLETIYMELRTHDLVIEADNGLNQLGTCKAFYERVKEVQVQRELLLDCWRFPMAETLEVDYSLYFGDKGLTQLKKDEDMSALLGSTVTLSGGGGTNNSTEWKHLKSISVVFPGNPSPLVKEVALSMRRLFIAWRDRGAPLESIWLEGLDSEMTWGFFADDLESIVTVKKENKELIHVVAELRLSASGQMFNLGAGAGPDPFVLNLPVGPVG